jgi:signal transduction histidine kinase
MDKNGVNIPVLLSGSPIIEKGKIIRKIGILKDMREIKRLEEDLLKKERFATMGELASGIAHYLRDPLSVIKNSIYFLNMKLKNPEGKILNHLNIIEREIGIANRIINGLLDLSKIKSSRRLDMDLNELIKDAIRHSQVPDNIKVEMNIYDSIRGYVDYYQIFHVITNIIKNAIQSMPNGGEVIIEALKEEKFIKLIFRDKGIGIPHEYLDKIFHPLFTTKENGAGIGLAISKNLVEMNGGKISVDSEVGKGTTFYVYLPCK